MSRRRALLSSITRPITLGALLVCAVACSAPGSAAPAAPPGPFPPRPYAIDVTRIDPCSALTEEQARQRGARVGQPGTVDLGVGAPSKACGWTNFDDMYGYNFQTVEAGATLAFETPGSSSVTVIDGFGAVLNLPGETNVTGPGIPQVCQMTIDVNTNQSIRLQVQSDDTTTYGSVAEQKKSCERVQVFAHDVLSTLSGQQR